MLKKHNLYVLSLLCVAPAFANVPIESRALSQNSAVAMNTGANVTTNLNWQLIEKNQQLEADVRTLRGKFEEQENTIETLKKELENRYTDLDARLEALQEKIDPQPEEAPEEDNQQDTAPSSNSGNAAKANLAISLPVIAKTAQAPTEIETQAYTLALDAYKAGGAQKAIQPMRDFIAKYPQSAYISNAHFWLAEFLLAIQPTDFSAAKQHFAIVANQYPNSSKASNALYRLYTIASNVDQDQALASEYKTKLMNQYPKSEEAKFVNWYKKRHH